MFEFLKWFLANPIGITVAVSALVSIIIVTFLQRYEMEVTTIWPPNIKPMKRVAFRQIVKTGYANFPENDPKAKEFFNQTWKGDRWVYQYVEFESPFRKHVEKVTVSLKKIDIGGSVPINRLEVGAVPESINVKGFNLYFKTWNDSIVFNASASWVAVGE